MFTRPFPERNWEGPFAFQARNYRKEGGDTVQLPEWKKVVVKVGSALVAPDGAGVRARHMLTTARFITECRRRGKEAILVSSGAVAAGLGSFGEPTGKRSIPEKQALAALGQAQLIAAWSRFFDFPTAQILLTYDDLHSRKRYVNARNTIRALLKLGALPIVNENDSVAVDELKVGDNDNLAAHMAVLADADLLLILSDVDGLYEANPRENPDARLIPRVTEIGPETYDLAGGKGSAVGTGGMVTKLQAADKATARGIEVVIANGRKDETVDALLQGLNPGTHFTRGASPLAARKHWLLHALPERGVITVDRGAERALCERGASLLPSGVIDVRGDFQRGDAVTIQGPGGEPQARGLAQYSADQLQRIKGCRSNDISGILGFSFTDVVVHRGDMVLLETAPV